MRPSPTGLTPEERERLALKGRRLYDKACGKGSRDLCAEGFALHHLRRGEPVVARDLLAFLDARIEALSREDPERRLARTRELALRLRRHLEEEDRGAGDA